MRCLAAAIALLLAGCATPGTHEADPDSPESVVLSLGRPGLRIVEATVPLADFVPFAIEWETEGGTSGNALDSFSVAAIGEAGKRPILRQGFGHSTSWSWQDHRPMTFGANVLGEGLFVETIPSPTDGAAGGGGRGWFRYDGANESSLVMRAREAGIESPVLHFLIVKSLGAELNVTLTGPFGSQLVGAGDEALSLRRTSDLDSTATVLAGSVEVVAQGSTVLSVPEDSSLVYAFLPDASAGDVVTTENYQTPLGARVMLPDGSVREQPDDAWGVFWADVDWATPGEYRFEVDGAVHAMTGNDPVLAVVDLQALS